MLQPKILSFAKVPESEWESTCSDSAASGAVGGFSEKVHKVKHQSPKMWGPKLGSASLPSSALAKEMIRHTMLSC